MTDDDSIVEQIDAGADHLNAFDLQLFTDADLATGPDRGAAIREARLAAGSLIWAASTMVDHLFDDLQTLHQSASETAAETDDGFLVLDELPPRYRHRYTELFVRKFLAATVAITSRLTAPQWQPPACVAEELALRMLIREAVATIEAIPGTRADTGWIDAFYDAAFDDVDHEFLYQANMDGIEDDPDLGPPGMAPMGFHWWFVPFNDERPVPPYVWDEPPTAGSHE